MQLILYFLLTASMTILLISGVNANPLKTVNAIVLSRKLRIGDEVPQELILRNRQHDDNRKQNGATERKSDSVIINNHGGNMNEERAERKERVDNANIGSSGSSKETNEHAGNSESGESSTEIQVMNRDQLRAEMRRRWEERIKQQQKQSKEKLKKRKLQSNEGGSNQTVKATVVGNQTTAPSGENGTSSSQNQTDKQKNNTGKQILKALLKRANLTQEQIKGFRRMVKLVKNEIADHTVDVVLIKTEQTSEQLLEIVERVKNEIGNQSLGTFLNETVLNEDQVPVFQDLVEQLKSNVGKQMLKAMLKRVNLTAEETKAFRRMIKFVKNDTANHTMEAVLQRTNQTAEQLYGTVKRVMIETEMGNQSLGTFLDETVLTAEQVIVFEHLVELVKNETERFPKTYQGCRRLRELERLRRQRDEESSSSPSSSSVLGFLGRLLTGEDLQWWRSPTPHRQKAVGLGEPCNTYMHPGGFFLFTPPCEWGFVCRECRCVVSKGDPWKANYSHHKSVQIVKAEPRLTLV